MQLRYRFTHLLSSPALPRLAALGLALALGIVWGDFRSYGIVWGG